MIKHHQKKKRKRPWSWRRTCVKQASGGLSQRICSFVWWLLCYQNYYIWNKNSGKPLDNPILHRLYRWFDQPWWSSGHGSLIQALRSCLWSTLPTGFKLHINIYQHGSGWLCQGPPIMGMCALSDFFIALNSFVDADQKSSFQHLSMRQSFLTIRCWNFNNPWNKGR